MKELKRSLGGDCVYARKRQMYQILVFGSGLLWLSVWRWNKPKAHLSKGNSPCHPYSLYPETTMLA